jgi:acyl carrier protein
MPKITKVDLSDWLHSYLADHLNKPAESIDFNANFTDLGMSSADAVITAGYLEEHFDIEVDATLFLRNRNIQELIADMVQTGLVDVQT